MWASRRLVQAGVGKQLGAAGFSGGHWCLPKAAKAAGTRGMATGQRSRLQVEGTVPHLVGLHPQRQERWLRDKRVR